MGIPHTYRQSLANAFSQIDLWAVQVIAALIVSALPAQATEECAGNAERLNELQYIGTHNSFHIEPDPAINSLIRKTRVDGQGERSLMRIPRSTAYSHPSIESQLQLGIRNFELDVFADPDGGRFSSPGAHVSAAEKGLYPEPQSLSHENMAKPGFKVLHTPDYDFRTSCQTFKQCLEGIKDWSDSNSSHVPIIILLDDRSGVWAAVADSYTPAAGIPFTADVWAELEREILEVFSVEDILTPDFVRGQHASIREAIESEGWPELTEVVGRVMFIVAHAGPAADAYTADRPLLKTRLMFVNLGTSNPSSSFVLHYNPSDANEFQAIREDVSKGFLVYTRADVDTEEARRNDTTRREDAAMSGAIIQSTDYPYPDHRLSDYKVQFPNRCFIRCNPITAPDSCDK